MEIKLPPSIPPEQRLGAFKNELQNKIEYVAKNQTYRDLKSGVGRLGDLSVDVDSIASKYGVKSDEAEKMYRQLKQKQIRSKAQEAFGKLRAEAEIASAMKAAPMEPPPSAMKRLQEAVAKIPRPESAAKKFKEVLTEGEKQTARNLLSGNIGKAAPMELSMLEKFARPVGSGLAGAIEAIPPMSKYAEKNPTASLAEIALSPEGSKGIARGVGAMSGLEAGAGLGSMSPVLKGPAILAGAVGGSMLGAKLADLYTGIPAIDKTIKALYEKELRKREAKMVAETESSSYLKNPRMADAAPRNMELRSGQ